MIITPLVAGCRNVQNDLLKVNNLFYTKKKRMKQFIKSHMVVNPVYNMHIMRVYSKENSTKSNRSNKMCF